MQRTERSDIRRQDAHTHLIDSGKPEYVLPEYAQLADMAAAFGSRMPAAFAISTLNNFSPALTVTAAREASV